MKVVRINLDGRANGEPPILDPWEHAPAQQFASTGIRRSEALMRAVFGGDAAATEVRIEPMPEWFEPRMCPGTQFHKNGSEPIYAGKWVLITQYGRGVVMVPICHKCARLIGGIR